METQIEVLQPNQLEELKQLISVFEDVFEMEPYQRPSQAHLQKLLEQANFFAIVAKADNKIIAGLSLYVLDQYYAEKPLAYIYDLAVLAAYQRKGVGKKLITFTNEFCRQKGFEEVFVQADKVDDYALDFYRATKPSGEEQVVHFYYKFLNSKDKQERQNEEDAL